MIIVEKFTEKIGKKIFLKNRLDYYMHEGHEENSQPNILTDFIVDLFLSSALLEGHTNPLQKIENKNNMSN